MVVSGCINKKIFILIAFERRSRPDTSRAQIIFECKSLMQMSGDKFHSLHIQKSFPQRHILVVKKRLLTRTFRIIEVMMMDDGQARSAVIARNVAICRANYFFQYIVRSSRKVLIFIGRFLYIGVDKVGQKENFFSFDFRQPRLSDKVNIGFKQRKCLFRFFKNKGIA